MTDYIAIPLNALMRLCYNYTGSYVLAIVVFTLLTKIILFPVGMWTQRESIKMVEMTPELNALKVKFFGDKDTIAEQTQALYKKKKYHPIASTVPMLIQLILLMGVIAAVKAMLGGDTDSIFAQIPSKIGGASLLMPLGAGAAALALGIGMNYLNPLQREQNKREQWITNGISIAISLSLGAFVTIGVCVYWIASNLFSILNQLALNIAVKPEKYIDYEALRKSQKELAGINALSANISKEDKKRERADYKHFFSVVNKHLVIYSESSGFYKYYRGIVEYLMQHTKLTIHYITSDPKDQIFEIAKAQPRIKPYFIGEKRLITLMMKLDCDVMMMTMPDLENYHIKRSYIRKDIEYICIQHGMGSLNLTLRKGAEDHYDTIFCCGEHHKKELELSEQIYKTEQKNLVEQGYCLIDEMINDYNSKQLPEHEKKQILIAPSWQKDNIIDTCLEEILNALKGNGYQITVRPHPQEVRHKASYMEQLKIKYRDNSDITIQTDFSKNSTVMEADLLITDWSDIAWEYAFTTLKPVLFVNTPMKVMNPYWQDVPVTPMNIALRDVIGKSVATDKLASIADIASELMQKKDEYKKTIVDTRSQYLYNIGESAEVGAKYLIEAIQKQIKKKAEK